MTQLVVQLRLHRVCQIQYSAGHPAISRPVGYEIYRLASNMPKPKKSRKPLKNVFLLLILSNQNEILKRGMTWTEQKRKGTNFKVQSIAIENLLYIDLIHQWAV